MRKSNAKETAKAIKRTLAYRSIFQYPMSFYQLATFLISSKPVDGKKLKETLNKLVKENWARKRYGKVEINTPTGFGNTNMSPGSLKKILS